MRRVSIHRWSKWFLVAALISLFSVSRVAHTERGEFKVKEMGEKLEVESPWGTKIYSANSRLDIMKNYRIEIPLDDLKPVGADNDYKDWFDTDDLLAENLEEFDRTPSSSAEQTENITQNISTNNPIPAPTLATDATKPPESKDTSDDIARMVVEANRFYNQGKYYESLLYVEEVLRKRPQFTRAWIMKGSLLHIQGHKDLAKEAWEQVLTFEPNNEQVKSLLQRYK